MTNTLRPKVRVPKAAELLADQYREAITTGRLCEGDSLPAERQLMAETGLGRGSIREALRLLEADGLVTIRPGRSGGVVVHDPSTISIERALVSFLRFHKVTIHDVIEARMVVETAVARLAAARQDADAMEEMRIALEASEAAVSSEPEFLEPCLDFDELVVKAAGNPVLNTMAALIRRLILAAVAGLPFNEADQRGVAQAHRAIYTAIKDGDPDKAERLVRRHLDANARQSEVYAGDLRSRTIMRPSSPSALTEPRHELQRAQR